MRSKVMPYSAEVLVVFIAILSGMVEKNALAL
jgi:hypothetical protein